MKRVIRCTDCELCAENWGVGFRIEPSSYICTISNMEVDMDDGCTKGRRGPHGIIAHSYDIDISDRAAVNGWKPEQYI